MGERLRACLLMHAVDERPPGDGYFVRIRGLFT
jgi:hypothetical protein